MFYTASGLGSAWSGSAGRGNGWARKLQKAGQGEYRPGEDPNQRLVGALRQRLSVGGSFNRSEKAFLRRNSPDVYTAATAMEAEQRWYARSLQRCATKEDERTLRFYKTMSVIAGADSRGQAQCGTDSNYTLPRLYALRRADLDRRA